MFCLGSLEASLCDQATQPFVNKRCPTFSCVLNYETSRNLKIDTPF
jgi:hypothetical protein